MEKTIIVSPEVALSLPEVFVGYIVSKAMEHDGAAGFEQTFILRPVALFNDVIQGITHFAGDEPCYMQYRVYGFPPVRCEVSVISANEEVLVCLKSDCVEAG